MKILVLMPCDERMTYLAAKIYKEMPDEIKDITFNMPMFMDFLITSKIVGNWVYAFYDSLISMKNVYNAAVTGAKDLIVLGTAPKNMNFDVIFNFQSDKEPLPYEDRFIKKIKTMVQEDKLLASYVNNLYTDEDSKLALCNCTSTANFLSQYIKTDPKLDEIKEKYKDKLKFKKGNGGANESSI